MKKDFFARRVISLPLVTIASFAWMSGALAADGVTTSWFDESLEAWRTSSTGSGDWVTSAGRWTPGAGDRSVCSNELRRVCLDTFGSEIAYRPCVLDTTTLKPTTTAKPGATNAFTRVTVSNMVFTAYRDGEEWDCVGSVPLAGVAMRQHNDANATLTFIGWVTTRDSSCIRGRWLELSSDEVAPAEGVAYTVTVETDFRTIPNRVRYLADGHPLRDRLGNDWFSIRNATLNPAGKSTVRVSKVCFNGTGSVGPITAETTARPVARGTVTAPPATLKRLVAGQVLDAAQFACAGATLGSDVRYQWYLTDATGMKVSGSERGETATYTLAAADYGHWVSVDVSDENGYFGTARIWFTNLPVVYIKCFDEAGYVETDDEVAADGKIYYRADDADNFYPLEDVLPGTDLAPCRAQYGKLFLADVTTAWPTAKKEDHKAYITIAGNADWDIQYDSDGVTTNKKGKVSETASKIHVRGNSTAGQDKKPYKIKLGKKADPFNLGGGTPNKHWVLLANSFDESLMRNKIAYDYAAHLGLAATHCAWVDVVMNDTFVGNYLLCQHIRVAPERVNIYDWSTAYEEIAAAAREANPDLSDDDVSNIETLLEERQGWMTDGTFAYLGTNYTTVAKGTKGPDGQGGFIVTWKDFSTDISGGYIFELDAKKVGPTASAPAASAFAQTHNGPGGQLLFNVAMNTPEFCFTNPTVSNYVWDVWSAIGQAWSSGTGYDAQGRHYSELCDVDSMVNYWLSMFVPGNNDAGSFSRYAYLDRGGKMTFGPAWDFDYGLDSLQIRTRRATVTNEYGEATYSPIVHAGWIPGRGWGNFMGGWTSDPNFIRLVRDRYQATRPYLTDIVKDGGLLDQHVEYLGPSARANDLRWNNRIGFFGNAEEMGDAEVLKTFLTRRFAWLDEQITPSLGTALANVTKTAMKYYARTTTVAPAVAGATNRLDTTETDLADVALDVKTAPVSIALAVPTETAAAVVVYVNGLSNGTFAVSESAATVELAAEDLTPKARNLIEFRVRKADGTSLANNAALVTANVPARLDAGSGDGQVPVPVTTVWLDAAYAKLVATNAVPAELAPQSYSDYVAFAKGSSLVGKTTSPWQDYVTDTNPADTNDVFAASIEIGADGLPRVTWRPDRSEKGGSVVRNYTLRGANDVSTPADEWDRITVSGDDDAASETFRRAHKFFKVEVSLP